MIRAVLVDDEQLALQHMKKKLGELGTVEVISTFSNAESFLIDMEQLDFQVVFLDIEMPGLNGLDLARIIKEWNKEIYIVFVTAYRDYAIQAFELHSIDYLLKPILKYRLEKTVIRIQEQIQLTEKSPAPVEPALPILTVNCFDEFIAYFQDEPVKWKTAKSKELFAFLVSNLQTYINRDTIIDQLWPEHDYKKAKIQLHTSMSHLRKTLDSIGYEQVIIFSNQSYALELDTLQCDAIELENMILQQPEVNPENIQAFERIVQQYTGDYMEKNSYEWATVKAQSIRQKLFQLLQKMIDYYVAYDDLDKKQHYLQMLLKLNPYSEHTLQQLMLHYVKAGNRSAAVQAYHHFSELLLDDIGIPPDRATIDIYESIVFREETH